MTDILRKLPKAELHVHIEAMIKGPEETRRYGQKNGITLDEGLFTPDGKGYAYNDFLDLVTVIYQAAASVLRTKEDYRDVVADYQARAAAEGSLYTEMIACPGECIRKPELSYKEMIDGAVQGIDKARKSSKIDGRINVTFERHRAGAEAEKDAALILSYPHPYIVGLDIAGGEQPGDSIQFLEIYDRVAKEFYNELFKDEKAFSSTEAFIDHLMDKFSLEAPFRATLEGYYQQWSQGGLELGRRLHAIEGAGPKPNGWDFLQFNPTRGGHLIRAEEDKSLVKEFVKQQISFELCPTSNILLCGKFNRSFADYPARAYFLAGAPISINTDDPGLLGCSIGSEYKLAHEKLGFTVSELAEITKMALKSAYAPESLKKTLLLQANSQIKKLFGPDNNFHKPSAPGR